MYSALHVHTDGSMLDGMSAIVKLIKRAKELGHTSLGISDHGTMINVVEFYKKCKEAGIKPIIGSEFYMGEKDSDDRFHICLYAINNTGLKNLYNLTTRANMENFYYKPRIDRLMLSKHNEGLICTTACLGSELAQNFMKKKNVTDTILYLNTVFADRVYYELQPNSMSAQKDYNKWLVNNIPKSQLTVGTDVHYVDKDDYGTHDTLLAMQTKKTKSDESRFTFSANEYYYMTEEEIYDKLNYIDKSIVKTALDNTNIIASTCNVEMDFTKNFLPTLENDKQKLVELTNKGIEERLSLGDITPMELPKVRERAIYELKNIIDKGLASYFLIVKEFYEYAENNDIFMGVGRGSVGGSEVAFLLGLTEVEPIRYGLLYERFMNPTRTNMADIDSDICYFKRDEMIKHLQESYGKENVSGVMAKQTFAFKKVIQDVMRVYDFPPHMIRSITKQIGDTTTFEELEANHKNLVSKFNNVSIQILQEMKNLHGLLSNTSKHAGGVIITTEPIMNIAPCKRDKDDETMMVVEFDKYECEAVGLVKFDLLGLKTNSILDLTLKNIKKNRGIDISRHDLFHIDYEDKGIYEVLNSGNLLGVFQLSAPAGKQTVLQVKPHCFEDIVACTSICRPGVKEANLYIKNKQQYNEDGEFEKPSYWEHVKDILGQTYGAIVYQEQTMLLFNKLGGYTLGEADKLRKAKSLEPERERFINGATCNGLSGQEATELFNRFDLGYSFNKSHAVAYSMISACCCYLLKNYRAEFISACMTLELTQAEPDIKGFMNEAKKYGVKFKGADINISTYRFEVSGDTILMPLNSIDKVGDSCAEHIISRRPFNSVDDFLNKIESRKCNKSAVKNLIKAGAFESFNKNRSELITKYNSDLKFGEPEYFWCDEVEIMYEKATYGFSINKHELDGVVSQDFNTLNDGRTFVNGILENIRITKDKKGNEMCFLTISNKVCTFSGLCFSFNYKKLKKDLMLGSRLVFIGEKEGATLKVDNIQRL